MNPIDALKNEHRLIEKVLTALDAYVTSLESGAKINHDDLGLFVRFIREFADKCHHGKEEGILFEDMVQHGFSKEMGPVAVMLMEHKEGRRLVGILGEKADKSPWTDLDRQQIAEAALGYINLLRHHIKKEDNILYPAAEAQLPKEVIASIAERFDRFEKEETGIGEHEKFHALADELIARYSPGKGETHHHH